MAKETDLSVTSTSSDVGTGAVFVVEVKETPGPLAAETSDPYKLKVFMGPNGSVAPAAAFFLVLRDNNPATSFPPAGVTLSGSQNVRVSAVGGAPPGIYTFRAVLAGVADGNAPSCDVLVH